MKIAFCSLALGVLWYVATPALADMGKDAAPLKAASGSKAESHIAAGIEHYGLGHWDVAKKHFTEAEKADPQSAEAHYDLALALDKTIRAQRSTFSLHIRSGKTTWRSSSRKF